MTKLDTKKQISTLAFLFAATYMISYMTRINYGAIISEMEVSTGFSRSLLSMALTGSFITYGVAVLSKKMGWTFTIFIWFIIAAVGTAICLLAAKPWAKKFGK